MGRLTTHVLDTARGRPGAGIAIALFALDDGERRPLGERLTNADGRCDEPLLEGATFATGVYELEFAVGDYFAGQAEEIADDAASLAALDGAADGGGEDARPRFLDRVVIRFGVASPDEHYHVPLLISPYAYSTYRGS